MQSQPQFAICPDGGTKQQGLPFDLPGLIAASIEQAYGALQPARMLLGRSLVYDGLHNRRVVSKADGLVLNTWLEKLNDLEHVPQILGTEGPIDPELWVARFNALDGRVLGTLVNFTCHPALHNRLGLKRSPFPHTIHRCACGTLRDWFCGLAAEESLHNLTLFQSSFKRRGFQSSAFFCCVSRPPGIVFGKVDLRSCRRCTSPTDKTGLR